MAAYYNEIDPFAAAWLRELIKAGHIADGEVDERSIAEVRGADLARFEQCHFFAGIGGWSYALRLADWPDDRKVWTGSCPCQPLSSAGQQKGHADERHLWPTFHDLIAECRPSVVFGEQVANQDGREWLSGVRADLEALGYACGCADLCAAGVGAPHIRQRLYWMANAAGARRCGRSEVENGGCPKPGGPSQDVRPIAWPSHSGGSSALSVSDVCEAPYGIPGRMGRLRGAGNAIVPQVARDFIQAADEAMTFL